MLHRRYGLRRRQPDVIIYAAPEPARRATQVENLAWGMLLGAALTIGLLLAGGAL